MSAAQEYCSVCKAVALFNDKRCNEPYCSQKCQIKDWPQHKFFCFSMSELDPKNGAIPTKYFGLMALSPLTPDLNTKRRSLSLDESSDNELVSINPSPKTVVVSDQTSSPTSTIIAQKQNGPKPRLKAAWQKSFPPPKNDSFEVIVKYVDDRRKDGESFVWLTEFRYINSLQKMINDINSTIDVRQTPPIATEHVCVGALVAALANKVLQRAEVLSVSQDKRLAAVRFIDIGLKQQLSFSKIFMPIPSMGSVNAYAFCVSVKDAPSAIKKGELAKIRVLDLKSVDPIEIYVAKIERKALPLVLPIDLLQQAIDVKLVKLFEGGQHALVQMTHLYQRMPNLSELIGNYSGQELDFNHPSERRRFVAARTIEGWQRAALLGWIEKMSRFLVYLIDVGRIIISSEIKKIPLAVVEHPAAVIAISNSGGKKLPIEYSSALRLKSELLVDSKPANTLRCMLLQKNNPLQTVVATSFFSDLNQLHVKYWIERVADGENVFLTHIISHGEMFVSTVSSADYSKMFAAAAPDCAVFTKSDDIAVGDCVLVMSQSVFRAEVLDIVDSGYNVRDIDTGASLIVSREMLRQPNSFVRACPVYVQQVKIAMLEAIPIVVPNNMALVMLKEYCDSATLFHLKYQAPQCTQPYPVVDLAYPNNPDQMLSKKLLPFLFEPAAEERDAMVNNMGKSPMASEKALLKTNPSPPSATPVSFCYGEVQAALDVDAHPLSDAGATVDAGKATIEYDIEDLAILKITTGDNVELLILDASTIDEGYITAADMTNLELLKQHDVNFLKLANYCKTAKKPVDYEPSYYKLCLAIYPVDGEWYRAFRSTERGNKNDETYTVMFVDYGNISEVSKNSVLPITSELMFPTNANVCFFEPALTKAQIESLKDKPTLKCKVTERGKDEYFISVHDFD